MKVIRALWFSFQFLREREIKNRYKETPQGQAEKERVYWDERTRYTRQFSKGANK